MAQKKNWYYVLVMTDEGPVFVTSADYSAKSAYWAKTGTPKAFDKSRAKDLALGLNLNFHVAFVVCTPFELDSQPYNYKDWHIEWKENEESEEEA